MPDLLRAFVIPAQREAVVHSGGPLLLVAGPGAGKTDVMVRRTRDFISNVVSTFSLLSEDTHGAEGFVGQVYPRFVVLEQLWDELPEYVLEEA